MNHIKKILISSFIVIVSSCSPFENEKQQQPNIIFLVSEDNSPLLGCYGDELVTTPNLDAFAERGVKFTNAFSNAPVCAPSRSTIISGMYATSMGTQHMRSENSTPDFIKFFPYYLNQDSVWDITDWWGWKDALIGKEENQPFFMMYNTWMSHESKIHSNSDNFRYFSGTMKAHGIDSAQIKQWWDAAKVDTADIKLLTYHPNTPEMKKDWAKYYECIELMDREMGVVLNRIKDDGYWENSIIFYFSDHGGVLARSKRFVYDSGLRVPFIMHVPQKYKKYVSQKMGTETNHIISFVDLAPTVLTLAGMDSPNYFEGKSILSASNNYEYAFGFRGRMDERYDMVRTVRDKKYRYIRNYMPNRISGGKIKYLWKAKSVGSWEALYNKGKCNAQQSIFWKTKPVEELYEISSDPDNINNLVGNPNYKTDLVRLRNVLQNHLKETKDLGFIPEAEMVRRSADSTPYDFIRSNNFPFVKVLETANIATEGNIENIKLLIERLSDSEPVVRYWAATGCAILREKAQLAKYELVKLLNDKSPSVRIATAEALFFLGEKKLSIETLTEIIKLKKMRKDDLVSNKKLYSNHFAITHALNVIDALSIDTNEIRKQVKQIVNSKRAGARDYDKRIAENILDGYTIKY